MPDASTAPERHARTLRIDDIVDAGGRAINDRIMSLVEGARTDGFNLFGVIVHLHPQIWMRAIDAMGVKISVEEEPSVPGRSVQFATYCIGGTYVRVQANAGCEPYELVMSLAPPVFATGAIAQPPTVGDVVRLITGGPLMAVEHVEQGIKVHCVWFVECHAYREWFAAPSLERRRTEAQGGGFERCAAAVPPGGYARGQGD